MRAFRALALLASLLPAPGGARDVAGVDMPEQMVVQGRTLSLNGAGLRRVFIFDVYVCALYVQTRSTQARQLLAGDEPWVVRLHFLRDVDHEKILDSFREAFERNSPEALERLRPGLARFHEDVMSDLTVHAGQELSIAYVPGAGSTLTVPGGRTSRYPGKEFGDALLRTWIGDRPSDSDLQAQLLGR